MNAILKTAAPMKLIAMSNQICGFFRPYPEDEAIAGIAEHIEKFWDAKMRATILAHVDRGGEGLEPHVKDALIRLKKHGN